MRQHVRDGVEMNQGPPQGARGAIPRDLARDLPALPGQSG